MKTITFEEVVTQIREDVDLMNYINSQESYKPKKLAIFEKLNELNISEETFDFISIIEEILEL